MIAPVPVASNSVVKKTVSSPVNQVAATAETASTEQKINTQIKEFILKLVTDLKNCDNGPTSNFYDKQHLLGAVSVVAFASSAGVASQAAAKTGNLAANMLRQIESIQTRFAIPGLLRALSAPAVFKELGFGPEQVWPEELSFQVWSSKSLKFLPVPPPSLAKVTLSGSPASTSATASANGQKAVNVEKATRLAAEWLRERLTKAYNDLQEFSKLSAIRGADQEAAKLVPGTTALKNNIFWQGFARCQGNHAALKKMFPNDLQYLEHQLALKFEKFGVPVDAKVYDLAYQKKGPKIYSLDAVVNLADFEKRRCKLEERLSAIN